MKHHQKFSARRPNLGQNSTQQLLLLVRANASPPEATLYGTTGARIEPSLQGSTLRSNPLFEVIERNAKRDI